MSAEDAGRAQQIAHVERGAVVLELARRRERRVDLDADVGHARLRRVAERLGARRAGQAHAGRRGRPRVGQRVAQAAVIDDHRAAPRTPVRAERLPGVVARDRLVDDRDVRGADRLAGAEPAVPRQDRRAEAVGLGGMAERLVREPLGQRVVDHERKRSRRVRRGVGQRVRQPARDLRPPQEQPHGGIVVGRGRDR